jgi:hypothetical protein
MVRGGLLVFFVTALDQAGFARKHIRKPAIPSQVYSVLAHSLLSDLHAFSPQSISLMTRSTWTSLYLVNNEQQATKDGSNTRD